MTPKLLMSNRAKIAFTTVVAAMILVGCEANTSKLDPKNKKQRVTAPSQITVQPFPSPSLSPSPSVSPSSAVTTNPKIVGTWVCSDSLSDKGACGTKDFISIQSDLKTMTQEVSDVQLKGASSSPMCDTTLDSTLTVSSVDAKGVMSATSIGSVLHAQEESQNKSDCDAAAVLVTKKGFSTSNFTLSVSENGKDPSSNDQLIIVLNNSSPKISQQKFYTRVVTPTAQADE
jgi:hypothetical protein